MLENSSSSSLDYPCQKTYQVTLILNQIFTIIRFVLIIPLSILVLYLGYRKCRRQRSSAMSHADVFTYNMAAMELIWLLGCILYLYSFFTALPQMMEPAVSLCSISYFGQTSLHILTCVERYFAVVHPITYLGLRKERWVRIRGVSIGCVWLVSFIWTGVTMVYYPKSPTIPFLCCLVLSLVVITFCSLSVLYALIRPAPGDRGWDKERVDQTKQKAFFTITAIMVVMWLWFGGLFVSVVIEASELLGESIMCVIRSSIVWLNLPASLVLPLLYLHNFRKIPCWSYSQ